MSPFALGFLAGSACGISGVLLSVFAGLPKSGLKNVSFLSLVGALSVNTGWAIEVFSQYALETRWIFPGLSGLGFALLLASWLRAVLTPHEDYVQVFTSATVGGCSIPLGYLAFLLGASGAIPAATVTAFISAWLALMVMQQHDEGHRGTFAAVGYGFLVPLVLIIPLSAFFSAAFQSLK